MGGIVWVERVWQQYWREKSTCCPLQGALVSGRAPRHYCKPLFFDKFTESLLSSIQSIFPASTSDTEGVREKLWSAFHTKWISELEGIWQDFSWNWVYKNHWILWFLNSSTKHYLRVSQWIILVLQAMLIHHRFSSSLNFDEENILRYVSGYPFRAVQAIWKTDDR